MRNLASDSKLVLRKGQKVGNLASDSKIVKKRHSKRGYLTIFDFEFVSVKLSLQEH